MYITDSNGNYIPATTIRGEDGKEVSIRTSAGYIQWKREDTDWTNLVPLDTLMGPSGKKVLLNAVGYILQYKYDGDADWITLCDLSTYFGNTAAATAAAAANAAADRANAAAELCEEAAAGAIAPHASSHGTGGSDPITPASIGAVSEQDMNGLAEYVDNIALGLENHTHTPEDIGAAATSIGISATLSSSRWSSNAQTVTVDGVTSTNNIIVSPTPESMQEYMDCAVYCSAQAANKLTFNCTSVPSANITVNVLIVG